MPPISEALAYTPAPRHEVTPVAMLMPHTFPGSTETILTRTNRRILDSWHVWTEDATLSDTGQHHQRLSVRDLSHLVRTATQSRPMMAVFSAAWIG